MAQLILDLTKATAAASAQLPGISKAADDPTAMMGAEKFSGLLNQALQSQTAKPASNASKPAKNEEPSGKDAAQAEPSDKGHTAEADEAPSAKGKSESEENASEEAAEKEGVQLAASITLIGNPLITTVETGNTPLTAQVATVTEVTAQASQAVQAAGPIAETLQPAAVEAPIATAEQFDAALTQAMAASEEAAALDAQAAIELPTEAVSELQTVEAAPQIQAAVTTEAPEATLKTDAGPQTAATLSDTSTDTPVSAAPQAQLSDQGDPHAAQDDLGSPIERIRELLAEEAQLVVEQAPAGETTASNPSASQATFELPTGLPASAPMSASTPVTATAPVQGAEPPIFVSNAESIADQVVEGTTFSARQGHKELTIKLNPGNLGEVRVNLVSRGNDGNAALSARLVASTPESHDVLQKQINVLKESLEAQGVRVERLSVVLANGTENRSDNNLNQGQSQHFQSEQQANNNQQQHRQPDSQQSAFNLAGQMGQGGGNHAAGRSGWATHPSGTRYGDTSGVGAPAESPRSSGGYNDNGQISILA